MKTEREQAFDKWVAAKEAHNLYKYEVFLPDRYNEWKGRILLELYQKADRAYRELWNFGLSAD